jgi:hypothetical protein
LAIKRKVVIHSEKFEIDEIYDDLKKNIIFSKKFINSEINTNLLFEIFKTINDVYGDMLDSADSIILLYNNFPIVCYINESNPNRDNVSFVIDLGTSKTEISTLTFLNWAYSGIKNYLLS